MEFIFLLIIFCVYIFTLFFTTENLFLRNFLLYFLNISSHCMDMILQNYYNVKNTLPPTQKKNNTRNYIRNNIKETSVNHQSQKNLVHFNQNCTGTNSTYSKAAFIVFQIHERTKPSNIT